MSGASTLAPLLRVSAIAFLLNAAWEFAQLPAFEGMAEVPLKAHIIFGGGAILLDALFTGGVYLVVSVVLRNPRWIEDRRSRGFAAAMILGAATAVAVELLALAGGWWRYSQHMPTIFGVGLLPLVQLTVLTPLSCRLAARRGRSTD